LRIYTPIARHRNVVMPEIEFTISTDKPRFDIDMIHGFLSTCYWSEGIPRDVVRKSIENSLCFGVFEGDQQVGFARVISDRATYAYIGDVFILESHRGRGLGKKLMAAIMGHPELEGLRRWSLVTRDAHGLYEQFGFTSLTNPQRYMERHDPDVYKQKTQNK
jgi:GNAT superfamily N-acetyltransferase